MMVAPPPAGMLKLEVLIGPPNWRVGDTVAVIVAVPALTSRQPTEVVVKRTPVTSIVLDAGVVSTLRLVLISFNVAWMLLSTPLMEASAPGTPLSCAFADKAVV